MIRACKYKLLTFHTCGHYGKANDFTPLMEKEMYLTRLVLFFKARGL